MIKSKTYLDVAESKTNLKNTNSFSDFNLLNLKGSQNILSFGEYSMKKNCSKENKRKVIYYFYNKITSKL